MNTLYVRCQTKDYILDIVAVRAGMRINKVNSVNEIMVTKLSDGPDLFDLKLTKHLFDGIPKYVINLLT